MKVVIQRVKEAKITVSEKIIGEIGRGIVVLLGITHKDENNSSKIVEEMSKKIINMRIFEDENDKMNLSLIDISGEILLIPNFTLYADASKGTRPSYTDAADKKIAEKIYNDFIDILKMQYKNKIENGKFGAEMMVDLTNDGPVTIILEL